MVGSILDCASTTAALHGSEPTTETLDCAGVVLREMRALERAAQCYQQALQLKPTFVQALNNLAVMHTMQASKPARHACGASGPWTVTA